MQTIDLDNSVVKIIGRSKEFHQAPVFLCPKYDEITKEFKVGSKVYKGKTLESKVDGVEVVEAVIIPDVFRITNHDSFRFSHLQLLELSKPIDKFMYELLMDSELCAENKSKVNPQQHRYYIENKELDAEVTISKTEKTVKALNLITNMKDEECFDFARLLLKTSVNQFSTKQVRAELLKQAYESPDKVLNIGDDKYHKQRIFIRKLIDKKILTIKGGKIYNGELLIGINEDYAAQFMVDSENNALVTQWAKELKANSKSSKATE